MHIIVVPFAACVVSLWIRRHTWFCAWERGATFNVATQLAYLLLTAPCLANYFGALDRLTGLPDTHNFAGHLCSLAGMFALTYSMVGRLTISNPRRYIRQHLELPMRLAVPALVGIAILAAPQQPVPDLLAAPAVGWLACYWLLWSLTWAWLLGHLLWAMHIIHSTDERAYITAVIYLAAIVLGCMAVATKVVSMAINGLPGTITWQLVYAAVVLHAVAPAYSWHRKTAHIRDFQRRMSTS